MYEHYFVKDQEKLRQIEDVLLSTFFTNYDTGFLETEAGREDINANVYARYNNALKHVVPWVADHINLQGKTLAEIGCGTGSSTAAFAHFVRDINGYDIDAQAVAGAGARLDIMGIDNVDLHVVTPEDLLSSLKRNHSEGIDIILLFAVLEHQTIQERQETIQVCWELLNPDGLLVVTETPNLLCYTDLHTSLLPFLHLLPSDLYARYAEHSTRKRFNTSFEDFAGMSSKDLDTSIMRWGRGVSYHDFELAIGKDYGRYLVANGFEEKILGWFEVTFEEELLRHYFVVKELDVPHAFSRAVLNVIFRKNEQNDQEFSEIPENKYISDMYTVKEQEIYINTLLCNLVRAEEHLNEILSSRRWRMGNLLAAPYRKFRTFFTHS